ncbi:MAG TPA: hypothetical protein VIM19_02530 [Actinomycetes bacterium]
MGESDSIDRPEPAPADAAGGVSHEVTAGPRAALTTALAPTPPAGGGALPSEQLRRLADRTAAALVLPVPAVDHEQQLPAEALARVLDAVEASTAAATKKAYRSDWDRFAGWTGRRRFPPLPTPPAVLAHYVTEAAAEQTCHLSQYLAHFDLTIWRSLVELSGVVDRLPPCFRSSRTCKAAERTLPEPRLRQRARSDCAT